MSPRPQTPSTKKRRCRSEPQFSQSLQTTQQTLVARAVARSRSQNADSPGPQGRASRSLRWREEPLP
eukprot:3566330-Pyramimonas_sp.AAC.1